jgi:hypothetical protein
MIDAIQKVNFIILINTEGHFRYIRRIAARPGKMWKPAAQFDKRKRIRASRYKHRIDLRQIIGA